MPIKTRNVFVSHHHKDDSSVDGLVNLASSKGYNLRNSSIRVKKENEKRINEKKISDTVLKRLLRMKMRWASQLIVIIGKKTYQRDWVNWEIEQANKLGKPIIGVFEDGLKDKVPIPKALDDYATSILAWRSSKIVEALEGKSEFQNPDGSPASQVLSGNIVC